MKKVCGALGWHLAPTVSSKNQYLTMPSSCSHFVIVRCVRTAGGLIFPSEIKYDGKKNWTKWEAHRLSHRCALRCLVNVPDPHPCSLRFPLLQLFVVKQLYTLSVATEGDSQCVHLSFLKLKSTLWENNLFLFLLDMKETYFEIVLLMLFLFFHVEILLILSLYLLLMICAQCVCVCVCQRVCVFTDLRAYACIWVVWCQLFVLFVPAELILSSLPSHLFPACCKQMWTCKDCGRSQMEISGVISERRAAPQPAFVPKSPRRLSQSTLTRWFFFFPSQQQNDSHLE